MSDEPERSSAGALIRTGLLVAVAIVVGIVALKVTVWAVKMLLWVAAAGAVFYGGWWLYKKLTGEKKEAPRALPPGQPASDDDLDELKKAMRELEQLKRERGE